MENTTVTIPLQRYTALIQAEAQRDIIACATLSVTDYRLVKHIKCVLGMVETDEAEKGAAAGA